jgi:hypothetical protein
MYLQVIQCRSSASVSIRTIRRKIPCWRLSEQVTGKLRLNIVVLNILIAIRAVEFGLIMIEFPIFDI